MNSEGAEVDYTYINPKAEVREIKRLIGDELIDDFDEEDEEFLDKVEPEFAKDNPKENLSIADKWIISRLNKTARMSINRLINTSFTRQFHLLYHFFWDDFCDWYIELVKDEITSETVNTTRDAARSQNFDDSRTSLAPSASVYAVSDRRTLAEIARNKCESA